MKTLIPRIQVKIQGWTAPLQMAFPGGGGLGCPHGHHRHQHRQCLAAHPGPDLSVRFSHHPVGRPFLCPGNYFDHAQHGSSGDLVGKKRYTCWVAHLHAGILFVRDVSQRLLADRFSGVARLRGRHDSSLGAALVTEAFSGPGARSGPGGDRGNRLGRVGSRAAGRRSDHWIGQLALDFPDQYSHRLPGLRGYRAVYSSPQTKKGKRSASTYRADWSCWPPSSLIPWA